MNVYPYYFNGRCPSCGRCPQCGQGFQAQPYGAWGSTYPPAGGIGGWQGQLQQYQGLQQGAQSGVGTAN